jgi:hypothetical protein
VFGVGLWQWWLQTCRSVKRQQHLREVVGSFQSHRSLISAQARLGSISDHFDEVDRHKPAALLHLVKIKRHDTIDRPLPAVRPRGLAYSTSNLIRSFHRINWN